MKACENLVEEGLDIQIPKTWCKQKMTIEAFSRCSHNFDEHREKFESLLQTASICIDALHVTFGCGDGRDRTPILEYDCVFAFGNKSWSFHSKFEIDFSLNQWEISVDATEKVSQQSIKLIHVNDDCHHFSDFDPGYFNSEKFKEILEIICPQNNFPLRQVLLFLLTVLLPSPAEAKFIFGHTETFDHKFFIENVATDMADLLYL